MLRLFSRVWHHVPTVWIDTETTGIRAGFDRAVQVGIVRFEGGKPVGELVSLVDPGMPIPAGATAIHGITDDHVRGMPAIADVFASADVRALLEGAQPAAYNAGFDREFVQPFGEDWSWPWLDSLSVVRVVDRYARGKGRHKLEASCQRHGIELTGAHDALADARAAGLLFYKLAPEQFRDGRSTLGDVLRWQRIQEAEEWHRFNEWRAKQPPVDTRPAVDREARV